MSCAPSWAVRFPTCIVMSPPRPGPAVPLLITPPVRVTVGALTSRCRRARPAIVPECSQKCHSRRGLPGAVPRRVSVSVAVTRTVPPRPDPRVPLRICAPPVSCTVSPAIMIVPPGPAQTYCC